MVLWNLMIIGLCIAFLPIWRQAITWTSAELLFIGPSGTNVSDILNMIWSNFHFKELIWKCHIPNIDHIIQVLVC